MNKWGITKQQETGKKIKKNKNKHNHIGTVYFNTVAKRFVHLAALRALCLNDIVGGIRRDVFYIAEGNLLWYGTTYKIQYLDSIATVSTSPTLSLLCQLIHEWFGETFY